MPSEPEKGHGRIETRRLRSVEVSAVQLGFPHARGVVEIERTRECIKTGKCSSEQALFVTSMLPEEHIEMLGKAARAHWGVENNLHWRRDAVCGEDRGRIRTPKVARAMASLRNLAIGLFENRKQVFKRYGFRSMPDMMETFAAKPANLMQWITQAKHFLL